MVPFAFVMYEWRFVAEMRNEVFVVPDPIALFLQDLSNVLESFLFTLERLGVLLRLFSPFLQVLNHGLLMLVAGMRFDE